MGPIRHTDLELVPWFVQLTRLEVDFVLLPLHDGLMRVESHGQSFHNEVLGLSKHLLLTSRHQIRVRQVAIPDYLVQLLPLLRIQTLQFKSGVGLLDDLVTLVVPVELHFAEV